MGYLLVPLHQPHLRWSPTRPGLVYHNLPPTFQTGWIYISWGVHSTSTGRVKSGSLHLYNVFYITLLPPAVGQYNQPCLCLHTGLRLGPWAPENHRKPLFVRGTQHQARAPDYRLSHGYLGFLLDGLSTSVCDVPDIWFV